MPRPLRIEYENAWYHVMNRGANSQMIYVTNEHKKLFLVLLQEIVKQFSVEIHSYCLMDNHYHLLLKTPYANLSKAMRYLNGVYTLKFNKKTRRDGSLFRGRYKAILIEADNYLLQVSKYIHLNPVKANICIKPHQYSWSSYRDFINHRKAPAWLQRDIILEQINLLPVMRSYKDFVEDNDENELDEFYNKKFCSPILGSNEFRKEKLACLDDNERTVSAADIKRAQSLPTMDKIIEAVVQFYRVDKDELIKTFPGRKNITRMIAIYLARRIALINYREIANWFKNISFAGIGAAINRCEKLIHEDKKIKSDLDELIKRLIL